jgi:glycosyltransferase involved in cell wall biosynthesis
VKLTVVIPCRDDPRVVDCVRSVDADAEVLIVLNGSPPAFRAALGDELAGRARIETLPRPNLSHALEHGIAAASCDRVLLMDSDCVFEPGSLAAIDAAFAAGAPDDEVYKGRIGFDAGSTWASAVIARSRAQRCSVGAYKPPLAFSRQLRARLGGYFFDARLPWKEDADFAHRIDRAGIRIVSVDGCMIHHAPLSVATDLRSSFRYGIGAAIARHLDVTLARPDRSATRSFRLHGLAAALYMLIANRARAAGYAYASGRIRLSRGRWPAYDPRR